MTFNTSCVVAVPPRSSVTTTPIVCDPSTAHGPSKPRYSGPPFSASSAVVVESVPVTDHRAITETIVPSESVASTANNAG